jgi:hypothetical protein
MHMKNENEFANAKGEGASHLWSAGEMTCALLIFAITVPAGDVVSR